MGKTHSKLQPGVWAQCLTTTLESCDIVSGWAFHRDGKQMKMSDFSETFFASLLDIQGERDDLIAGDIDVLDAYGLARSLRRGATTRAQLAQVPQYVIDWVNHWNIGEDDVVHGPMRVVYSERKQMMETFLAFSLAL
jgi:hypothetical protein